MEFFFYCRDKPGSAALREELAEAHQSFMDRLAVRRPADLAGPTRSCPETE